MVKKIKNIVIIGSGNVSWHLARAFGNKELKVLQILAHNEKNAIKLSRQFSIPYIMHPGQIVKNADLYVLAVQDDRLAKVADSLGLSDQFLVHTSGFSSIDILKSASLNYGVLWPLQTLTAGKSTDYTRIPFFIEANSDENVAKLSHLAGLISNRVVITDSSTRQKAHLAAVIASNMVNRLYAISALVMEKENLSFDLLKPIIRETAKKAIKAHPVENQTGPAIRKDLNVISKHLEVLHNDPEFKEIYRLLSENIIHHYHGKSQ